MDVPPEITFHGVAKSDAVEYLVLQQIAKLERVCPRLTSCRVAIEKPHEHARAGNPYRVRIDMRVPPSHELVAVRDPLDGVLHDSLQTVVLEAFRVARRQLQALAERQRREVKTHAEPQAVVVRLFPDKGYGFMRTPDGRDLYFHEHSVLHGDFARLRVGTAVRFEEEEGEEGPQASTVQIVDHYASPPGAAAVAPEPVAPEPVAGGPARRRGARPVKESSGTSRHPAGPESGRPGGGRGRREDVRGSGVYPASAGTVPDDAVVRAPGEWGGGPYEESGRTQPAPPRKDRP